MSVIIRNMKTPENCASCDIVCRHYLDFGVDGLLSKICRTESRRLDCPLIPVSDHGRLIDADVLTERLESGENNSLGQAHAYYRFAKEWVKEAPTIIETDV